jgi:hypothetical protein
MTGSKPLEIENSKMSLMFRRRGSRAKKVYCWIDSMQSTANTFSRRGFSGLLTMTMGCRKTTIFATVRPKTTVSQMVVIIIRRERTVITSLDQKMEDSRSKSQIENEARCGRLLGWQHDLELDKDSIPLILNHIDYFVSQCRGNKTSTRNASVISIDAAEVLYGVIVNVLVAAALPSNSTLRELSILSSSYVFSISHAQKFLLALEKNTRGSSP